MRVSHHFYSVEPAIFVFFALVVITVGILYGMREDRDASKRGR